MALAVFNVPAPPESVNFDASLIVTFSLKVKVIFPLTATSVAPLAGVELDNVGGVTSPPPDAVYVTSKLITPTPPPLFLKSISVCGVLKVQV